MSTEIGTTNTQNFLLFTAIGRFPILKIVSCILQLVKRHAAEIFTSVIISTIFSLYSTALIGRFIGLEPNLTVSILPRCITVALALSIVTFFEGTSTTV